MTGLDLEGGHVAVYLNIIQIIVSVALVVVVLLQAKGGGLSNLFGGEGAVYRTRRGLEQTLYRFTIALAIVFAIVSLLSVIVQRV
jgi:preprotein translocase subunit SecG